MISLIQNRNGIIGDSSYIKSLNSLESARILVVSDSHGDYSVFRNIITRFGKTTDALVFCGDGASEIAGAVDEAAASAEFAECVPGAVIFVRGNGDPGFICTRERIRLPEDTEAGYPERRLSIPTVQTAEICGRRILVAHGHTMSIKYGTDLLLAEATAENCGIAIFGHSHIPENRTERGVTLMNPGSCSLPRGGFPPSFAIMTIGRGILDTSFIRITRKSSGTEFSLFTPPL